MQKIYFVAILLLLLCANCRKMQEEPTEPGNPELQAEDLSNQQALCFGEDKDGYLWIGTARGLNKYNGYHYRHYIHSDKDSLSLVNNYVQNIFTASTGQMWITTRGGINTLNENEEFIDIPVDSPSKNIRHIAETDNRRLFINTVADICEYDEASNRFVSRIRVRDSSAVNGMIIDKRNRIWLVGIDRVECYGITDFRRIETFHAGGNIHEVYPLSNGELWLCVENKLMVLDTKSMRFILPPAAIRNHPVLSAAFITRVYAFDTASILLQTKSNECFLYNTYSNRVTHQSDVHFPFKVPGTAITTLFTDSNRNLWMGSYDRGFFVHYHNRQQFNTSHEHLSAHTKNQSITSMVIDREQNLWVITRMNKILAWDKADGQIREINLDFLWKNNPYHTDWVTAVFADSKNNIWLQTYRDLVQCRYVNKQLELVRRFILPTLILSMAEDEQGALWAAGADVYLYRLPVGATQFDRIQMYSENYMFTNKLLALSDGKLLLASFGRNPLLMDTKTLATEEIPILPPAAGSPFVPTELYEDKEGNIWTGSLGHGLFVYNRNRQEVRKAEGMPCDEISSIIEDSQANIWIGTLYGLVKYNRKENSFITYYSSDGTGGNQFNERAVCRLADNVLVFGGTHGLTVFDPKEIAAPRTLPLYIEELRAGNSRRFKLKKTDATHATPIRLPHHENNISISYSALDYSEYHRIRYAYRLKGFHERWIDAQNLRQAFYSNLPAGSYTFEVKIVSNDHAVTETVASLPLRILRAPGLSIPAMGLYVALLLAVVLYIFYLLRKKAHEQYINRTNMDFFANVSHEFRTPLTMISGPLDTLCRDESIRGENKRLLQIAQRSVVRMFRLVDQILDFGKMENGMLHLRIQQVDVIKELHQMMEVFVQNANEKNILLHACGLEDVCMAWVDADKLDKIVTNLIVNALKFTPPGGQIEIRFQVITRAEAGTHCKLRPNQTEASYIKLTVEDNGRGIPPNQLENIFKRYYQIDESSNIRIHWGTGIGLYYARKLAELHGGNLFAGNRPQGGALFTLLLPVYGKAPLAAENETENHAIVPPTVKQAGKVDFGLPSASAGESSENTLLIIDDDTDISRYMRELFSSSCKVVNYFDAESAWQRIEEIAPDLIVCDVIMPGMDGYAFCKQVKDNLSTCHIPVILLTAKMTIDDQVEGLNVGANAYVTKPFDPAYLTALVHSQLRNRDNARRLLAETTQTDALADEMLSVRDKLFMDSLYQLMENELSNPELNITRMTEVLHISRTKFYYKIKGLTGVNPSVFFKTYKLNRAVELMKENKYSLAEIADITGFSTLSHFSVSFKKQFGSTPSKYINQPDETTRR
ncbi:MAG: response regulator [Tannerellaceae bacterium]|jgi:signal transduction histidine kinase/DNA-binding response OmpR family regulator/ligand-binding sensor domain-containing protein|nr:response regulator [Tannerellaceae bacterium]